MSQAGIDPLPLEATDPPGPLHRVHLPLQVVQVGFCVRRFLMNLGISSDGYAKVTEPLTNQFHQLVRVGESAGDRPELGLSLRRIAP